MVLLLLAMPRFTRLQKLVDRLDLKFSAHDSACASWGFDREASVEQTNADLMNVNITVNRIMGVMQPVR